MFWNRSIFEIFVFTGANPNLTVYEHLDSVIEPRINVRRVFCFVEKIVCHTVFVSPLYLPNCHKKHLGCGKALDVVNSVCLSVSVSLCVYINNALFEYFCL